MTDFANNENCSNVKEHHGQDEEEDGIVEYLEIDSEVMDTLQDPNDYFTQVNESPQNRVYVQQNAADTQQLSLVIENPSNHYTTLKQISSQQMDDHNSLTNVLWTNNILASNDSNDANKTDYSHKFTVERKNCKLKKKRKMRSNSPENSKSISQSDVTIMNNGQKPYEGDSLDLFFQSMAQTVSHLPPRIQAKIKMDICNVISMAEIKYCSQETVLHDNVNETFNSKN